MEPSPDDLDRLKSEEADLERRLLEVRRRRADLERRSRGRPEDGRRSLREITLDMLQESGCPLNSLLLASVIRPVHGRNIPSTRFGTLSDDEVRSYDSSRPRPVYLCHCLTHDQGQAVKRFWARSDWPLTERIMGPMTGRILFLKGAVWTINLARLVEDGLLVAADSDTLKYVAADQARDAGLSVKRGEFPYEGWLATIKGALDRHLAEDRVVREVASKALVARLSDRELLFGSRAGFVSLPGSSQSWRSTLDER
jgi:hypothetical protein